MKSLAKTLFLASVCFALLVELSAGCSLFETESSCSNPCEPTCDNTAPDCREPCIPGSSCVCSTGFVRDRNGVCTFLTTCPPRALITIAPTNPPQVVANAPTNPPPGVVTEVTEVTELVQVVTEIPAIICGQNATLSQCKDNCEASCDNLEPFCSVRCEEGTSCACDSGFVRNIDGDCILESDCPPRVPCGFLNEIRRSCANKCEPTCDDLAPMCTDQCEDGNICICEPFYVRSATGECILPTECPQDVSDSTTTEAVSDSTTTEAPPSCPNNETYSDCGSACPATCKNLNSGVVPCITLCVQGCFCDEGLVRNEKGNCVPFEQCTNADCESHEEFKMCGTDCGNCKRACYPGCFCKKGLSRNSRGECGCSGLIPCILELFRKILNFVSSVIKKIFG